MPDQYTRTRAQLGTPALDALRKAHVAVFGIGGVGGQAVEVLARSGVGELSLFDSDIVALSNLNRQLVALHSTLGQYKVDAMAARIADIDPTIVVHANRMFYNAETAADVDLTQFDYVLDCIDTVSAKLLLIRRCKEAGVSILCSMGAANKLDPTAFKVADIEKTTVDPLAKVIRIECRKRRLGKVKVVFSEEPPLPPLRERIEAALHQIEFAAEIKGERLACLEARSQFCWYLRGVPHANVYKQEVVHVETLDDLRRITRAIQRDLRD